MRTTMVGLSEMAAFLADLGARGFRLEPLPGGRILVRPASQLDEETADRIRVMRAPLREALTGRHTGPCDQCGRFLFTHPTVCFWCRRMEARPGHA